MNILNRLPSAVAALIYREPDPADLEIDADAWTSLTRQGQVNAKRAREWRAEIERRKREEAE